MRAALPALLIILDLIITMFGDEYKLLSRYFLIHNPLKPSGYYIYDVLQHTKTLHSAHGEYVCVPYGSQ
jgi:hypothetical protein